MNPFSDTPSAVAGGTCAVCGQRPGTLRVVASDGVQRRAATVCEPCANRLMAAQAQGAPLGAQPIAQPGADAPQSETPTLDEFGRDLTDEARNGRIDPVIGRAERDRADRRDPRPPAQEQRRADRRGRRRQDRDRGGPRPAGSPRATCPRRCSASAWSRSTSPAWSPARSSAASSSSGSRPRSPRSPTPRAASCCSSTSCTRSSAPATPRARWTPRTCSSRCSPAVSCAMVGATTLAEYRKIERDGALARRFSPVTVEEPSVEETVEILRGLRGAYEEHHGVDDRRRGARRRGAAAATATSPSTACPTRRSTWSTRPPRRCACAPAARPTPPSSRPSASGSRPRSRPRSTRRPTRTRRRSRSTSSGSSSTWPRPAPRRPSWARPTSRP